MSLRSGSAPTVFTPTVTSIHWLALVLRTARDEAGNAWALPFNTVRSSIMFGLPISMRQTSSCHRHLSARASGQRQTAVDCTSPIYSMADSLSVGFLTDCGRVANRPSGYATTGGGEPFATTFNRVLGRPDGQWICKYDGRRFRDVPLAPRRLLTPAGSKCGKLGFLLASRNVLGRQVVAQVGRDRIVILTNPLAVRAAKDAI